MTMLLYDNQEQTVKVNINDKKEAVIFSAITFSTTAITYLVVDLSGRVYGKELYNTQTKLALGLLNGVSAAIEWFIGDHKDGNYPETLYMVSSEVISMLACSNMDDQTRPVCLFGGALVGLGVGHWMNGE